MQQPTQTQVNDTPQLRVVLTPYCNLKCVYCRPGGEGYGENLTEHMTTEELITIIRLSAEVGFTHVKFTGGEPLMRSDLLDIIKATKLTPGIREIQMVTNGTLLYNRVAELRNAGLDWITISLDAADPDIFRRIRGTDLSAIVQAIKKCRSIGLPVRINMVVMKSNLDQVQPMIDLASELGCSLKLLDLIWLDGDRGYEFSRREYVHFESVYNELEQIGTVRVGVEETPGGIGAPLMEYQLNNLQIVVKDSTKGTYYHPSCKSCQHHPCQDALISVRLTHDGHLKRCLIRNDNLVSILPLVRGGQIEEAALAIQETFKLMVESTYHPFAWRPTN